MSVGKLRTITHQEKSPQSPRSQFSHVTPSMTKSKALTSASFLSSQPINSFPKTFPEHSPSTSTMVPTNFRHFTEPEMRTCREKGLCFRCDEKFSPIQWCQNKKLQILWIEDIDPAGTREPPSLESEGVDLGEKVNVVELSLSSLAGFTMPYSMKIRERVRNRVVIVLIDCGATQFHLFFDLGVMVTSTVHKGLRGYSRHW